MGGGFVRFVIEISVLAGAAAFAASGLMWYLYFYRKEKKLLERLYDIIEQAEESCVDGTDETTDASGNIGQAEENSIRETVELTGVPGNIGQAEGICVDGTDAMTGMSGKMVRNYGYIVRTDAKTGFSDSVSRQALKDGNLTDRRACTGGYDTKPV